MESVNILLGRFQPFTEGHFHMIESAYKINNLPTVILIIDNQKFDDKHPFKNETIESLIKSYQSIYIKDILFVKNADIGVFGKLLHEHNYEPYFWICGSDRFKVYDLMCNKYKDQFNLPNIQALEIHRTETDISATKVRQSLIDNNYKDFCKNMSNIVNLDNWYTILQKEIYQLSNENNKKRV